MIQTQNENYISIKLHWRPGSSCATKGYFNIVYMLFDVVVVFVATVVDEKSLLIVGAFEI